MENALLALGSHFRPIMHTQQKLEGTSQGPKTWHYVWGWQCFAIMSFILLAMRGNVKVSKPYVVWYTLYSVHLRPGDVWNGTGSVVLVPSWLEADTVARYSIPGTVSTICWVTLPSSRYCWAIVPFENSTVSVRDSALSSACWCVRDHVTCTWELVVFDTLTLDGRAGRTVLSWCVLREGVGRRKRGKKKRRGGRG